MGFTHVSDLPMILKRIIATFIQRISDIVS